jgi:deoxyribonuclease-1
LLADALGCGNRTTCANDAPVDVKERFNRAEADLHNLWPAVASLNFSRGGRLFGHVGSASQTAKRAVKIGAQTFHCQFENVEGIVEPRRIVRGNLARSIFYMCEEYGFPVETAMLDILKRCASPMDIRRRLNPRSRCGANA